MRHSLDFKKIISGIALVLVGLTACSSISTAPTTSGGSGMASGSLGSPAAPTASATKTSATKKTSAANKTSAAKMRKSSHHRHHISTPAPPQQSPTTPAALPQPTTPAGCYPLSNEGTCYEPGEYCRNSDHGMTGQAGDGETIICTDNNGWRWEPA